MARQGYISGVGGLAAGWEGGTGGWRVWAADSQVRAGGAINASGADEPCLSGGSAVDSVRHGVFGLAGPFYFLVGCGWIVR